MTASLSKRVGLTVGALLFVLATVWTVHHATAVTVASTGRGGNRFTFVYAAMFIVLVGQFLLAHLERPAHYRTNRQQRLMDDQIVLGIIPAYNEDPAALRATLESMIDQTRRPDVIAVVDDGSPYSVQVPAALSPLQRRRNRRNARWGWLRMFGARIPRAVAPEMVWTAGPAVHYMQIRDWFIDACHGYGISPLWIRQANAGKRHAQIAALDRCPHATVVWTGDSDGIFDRHALEELLKPLANPDVMSVAGIVMAANVKDSTLCRFTDLWFVTGQLVDRSALSALGTVWVNSGPIAVYRADVIRSNRDLYLNEWFGDRKVNFSDDSLLTLFAMLRGRTVQQPTAFAFSLMPAKLSHHGRQFIRWMRGSFIRSFWRVKFLSWRSAAFWMHLARWAQTVLSAMVFVAVVVYGVRSGVTWEMAAWLAAVPMLIGYAQTLRYMVIRRSDQSRAYQWGTWALTPLAVLWSMFVLRAMRWYGIVTCRKTGWGTRKKVEVRLRSA